MSRPPPFVCIIILNWNGWEDTLACVASCRKLTWPNLRILIVDNGSTDGSEEILRRNLPEEEIIQTGRNLGFSGGNNVGIRRAMEEGAEYLWLLNNDTVVDPEALTALVEAMETEPTAAIAGSKVYFHDDPRIIWSAGGQWMKGSLALRDRGRGQLDEGTFAEPCELDSVSGCSMLVRASAIQKTGMMAEDYFLYWEDTEWCARAREKGYRVLFVPGSHIWHKVSASTGQHSCSQYYYYTRNGLSFLWAHDQLLLPLFILYNVLFGLKSLFIGNVQPLQGLGLGFVAFLQGAAGPRLTRNMEGLS